MFYYYFLFIVKVSALKLSFKFTKYRKPNSNHRNRTLLCERLTHVEKFRASKLLLKNVHSINFLVHNDVVWLDDRLIATTNSPIIRKRRSVFYSRSRFCCPLTCVSEYPLQYANTRWYHPGQGQLTNGPLVASGYQWDFLIS